MNPFWMILIAPGVLLALFGWANVWAKLITSERVPYWVGMPLAAGVPVGIFAAIIMAYSMKAGIL